uniref:NADH-ubiquinone oxidoreductase chain 1 n=1 Tax=Caligus rogercresseyi TaxID=217165 RepID=E1B2Q0_CALRO|nr:NADH dehydrogenase subunit 1 [Caligus rogercresseyi]
MISIPVLVNVAFVTLLERKIIGYSQARKGPNKVSFMGVLQPFSDAIKLFMKEVGSFEFTNTKIYMISPLVGLSIILLIWNLYPLEMVFSGWKISWIALLVGMSLSVYPLFLMGWSSNCVYSYIGGIRGVAQVISYEVVFTMLIFVFMLLGSSYTMVMSMKFSGYFLVYILSPLLIFMWFMVGLAETNRTPFDFSEGESELVSGFNTEYGGSGFALIFMAEYASIIFLSSLFGVLMVNSSGFLFYIIMSCGCFVWVWSRVTYPRHRYDWLMMLCWKSLLPSVLLVSVSFLVMLICI